MSAKAWFRHDRFGMFVHWGLYSLAARHEWVKNRERMTDEQYARYFERFDPDLYDPREWARSAQRGRHAVRRPDHQAPRRLLSLGQCADRLQGDQHAVRTGPAPAVRRGVPGRGTQGRLLSLADRLASPVVPDRRAAPAARRRGRQGPGRRDATSRSTGTYLHGQVRELLTDFGTIDYLFFDFSYAGRDAHVGWEGRRGVGRRGVARDGPGVAAGHPGQRPDRAARATS